MNDDLLKTLGLWLPHEVLEEYRELLLAAVLTPAAELHCFMRSGFDKFDLYLPSVYPHPVHDAPEGWKYKRVKDLGAIDPDNVKGLFLVLSPGFSRLTNGERKVVQQPVVLAYDPPR